MASIFITGACGFIGQHMIRQLQIEKHNLHCLVRNVHPIMDEYSQIDWIFSDINYPDQYISALKNSDYVIHLAGIINSRNREDFYRTNVEGTRALLRACCENNCNLKRFVLMSSIASLGPKSENTLLTEEDLPEPETEYGRSKLQAEKEALKFTADIPIVILRPTFIYGPGDIRGLKILKQLSEQNELISFSIIEEACLCYISDLISACLLSLTKQISSGEIFHVSDSRVYAWRQVNNILKQVVSEVFGNNCPDNYIFKRSFDNNQNESSRQPLRKYWGCSIEKATSQLEYKPRYTLLEGARETIRWYRDNNLYNSYSGYNQNGIMGRNKK